MGENERAFYLLTSRSAGYILCLRYDEGERPRARKDLLERLIRKQGVNDAPSLLRTPPAKPWGAHLHMQRT